MKQVVGILVAGAFFAVAVPVSAQTDPNVAVGRKLFSSKNCVKCHMAEGKGNKKLRMDGPNAAVSKLSAGEIEQWIISPAEMTAKLDHKPVNPMKKTELTDPEIKALVAYMMSLRTQK